MNQPFVSRSIMTGAATPERAAHITKLERHEVIPMAREELGRFVQLLEGLSAADWDQPTDCALWSVRDVVAHQGSHVFGLIRVREFLDQFNPLKARDYLKKGMNSLDAANQRQVDQRAGWTPAQLIAEIRDHAEASMAGRQRFPAPLRWFRVGVPGYEGTVSVGDLIDVIYTRDMWMHRADICRATGQEMVQTAEHDGRITALVLRELDRHLTAKLGGRGVIYRLTGKGGGEWLMGGDSPSAQVTMEVLELHHLASGRIRGQQALETGLATVEGDEAVGRLAIQHTMVLY